MNIAPGESTALAQLVQQRRRADGSEARAGVVVQAPLDGVLAVRVEIVATNEARKVVSLPPARVVGPAEQQTVSAAGRQDAEPGPQPFAPDDRRQGAPDHAWTSTLLRAPLLEPEASPGADVAGQAGRRALAAYGAQVAIAARVDEPPHRLDVRA